MIFPPSLQDLPPRAARFCLEVQRFMEGELGLALNGRRLLAAFSGGADSSALLICLRYLAPRAGFELAAAHLDHRLRPSSAQEARHCLELCAALGVKAVSGERDVAALARERGLGIEEAAREARYAFLEEQRAAAGCSLLAVGHNADDLAEDVLMRLIRGTGWPGLAGMRAFDEKRSLLRPLLLTSREKIEFFLRDLGLDWLTDESNGDTRFFRNRVRARLLPLILEENPSFLDAVAGLWRLGRLDETFFTDALERVEQEAAALSPDEAPDEALGRREVFFPRASLLALPKALRLRLYKSALDGLGAGRARLAGLLAADAALVSGKDPTEHRFSGGKRIVVRARGLRVCRESRDKGRPCARRPGCQPGAGAEDKT